MAWVGKKRWGEPINYRLFIGYIKNKEKKFPLSAASYEHDAEKKNNATGGKNEIPSWEWFRAFFFFFFIGGRQ